LSDFTVFYDSLAQDWKKDTTPQKLKESFQKFIDNKIDLTFVKQNIPTIEKEPIL
jgi:hypothetical protein